MKTTRRAVLKPSFMRTIAVAVVASGSIGAASTGCGGVADGGPVRADGCPTSMPQSNAPCALAAAKSCDYAEQQFCGISIRYTCNDGKWSGLAAPCNPPAPACPRAAPAVGSLCGGVGGPSFVGQNCQYTGDCVGQIAYRCSVNAKWEEVAPSGGPLNFSSCPEVTPANGQACTSDCARLSRNAPNPGCNYLQNACGFSTTAECSNNKWRVQVNSCNPPPPPPPFDAGADADMDAAVDAGAAP